MTDINYRDVDIDGWHNTLRRDFLELWPCEVVEEQSEGSYQGTYFYLLRKKKDGKDVYALLNLSYGSCSHCDELKEILWAPEPTSAGISGANSSFNINDDNIDDLRNYFERARKQLQWKEPIEMIHYLDDPPAAVWRDDINFDDFKYAVCEHSFSEVNDRDQLREFLRQI